MKKETSKKPGPQEVVVNNKNVLQELKNAALQNVRKRTLQMLHSSHAEELHTMINVFTKGSYAAPHVHWIEKEDNAPVKKGESFIVIEGTGKIILFSPEGVVEKVITLDAAEQTMVWIPAGVWHTVVCTSEYFIVFENKTGPWVEGEDKLFHPAFPKEGDPAGEKYVKEWEAM
jgi:cupin fold WbuC family metalloprotein